VDLIEDFGLKPGGHYPAIILHYADVLADTNLQALILLAAGYVVLRFFEAYGLWYQRTWGQWLGALSGGLYVPFELWHLVNRPSLIGVVVLVSNVGVVGFLVYLLWRERRKAPWVE
jgi:uncharacterized membrane protein (DUF2068 family)